MRYHADMRHIQYVAHIMCEARHATGSMVIGVKERKGAGMVQISVTGGSVWRHERLSVRMGTCHVKSVQLL